MQMFIRFLRWSDNNQLIEVSYLSSGYTILFIFSSCNKAKNNNGVVKIVNRQETKITRVVHLVLRHIHFSSTHCSNQSK